MTHAYSIPYDFKNISKRCFKAEREKRADRKRSIEHGTIRVIEFDKKNKLMLVSFDSSIIYKHKCQLVNQRIAFQFDL